MNPTSVFSHSHNTNKFDLIEICRVCLSRDINMDYLFDDKNNKTIDKIEFCTGIQLKEEKGLPNQICKNCFNKLSIAHKFKSMCLLSEQRLHQIILKRINLETADEKRNIVTNNDYCIQNVDDLDRNEYQGQYIKGEVEVEFVNPDDSFPQEELKGSNVHSEIRSKEEKLNIIIEVHKEEVQSKPEDTKLREQGPYKNCEPQQNKKFNRLKCGPCNIQFSTKRESDNHKKEVHSENLCWICEVCGKKFLNPSSYYTHVRSHLPDRLECAHCDYRCVTKSDMEKHLRVHSGIKKFKCTQCSAGFHTTSNLNDHVRRCHSSAEKRFACELCPKRFHERSKLNRHLDTHNDCKRTQQSSQGSQNIIIETGHHQDQLNTRHTINVIVNNNKKERQKRYREQNRDKLKQREAERRKRIQYSQSIAGPSTSSRTNRIELNNEEIITAQCSSGSEKIQPSSIQRNDQGNELNALQKKKRTSTKIQGAEQR